MTRSSIVALGLAAGLLVSAAGSGCASDTYGVDIENKTGQILTVTYLDVASDGSTRPYAGGTLAKNGTFMHQVARDQQGFGKRVRFSIPDRAADDPTSNVELKLADDRVRDYDLMMVNGRLVAREHKKGRATFRAE